MHRRESFLCFEACGGVDWQVLQVTGDTPLSCTSVSLPLIIPPMGTQHILLLAHVWKQHMENQRERQPISISETIHRLSRLS